MRFFRCTGYFRRTGKVPRKQEETILGMNILLSVLLKLPKSTERVLHGESYTESTFDLKEKDKKEDEEISLSTT